MNYNLITILGPTAVGKTRLASNIAYSLNSEIISADSRQVYRGMDVGTGKDLDDYLVFDKLIPYHLIDIISPQEEFNLFLFQKMFYEIFGTLINKKVIPILAGGTGLYLSSILESYELKPVEFSEERITQLSELSVEELQEKLKLLDSELHNTTDLLHKERIVKAIILAEESMKSSDFTKPAINSFTIGIQEDREKIKKNISIRLKERLKNGMIEEVEHLVSAGVTFEKLIFFGLEYKFIGQYLSGDLNYNDMYQKLNSSIHSFAKRQMTWFRKMERNGVKIHWIDGPDFDEATKLMKKHRIIND